MTTPAHQALERIATLAGPMARGDVALVADALDQAAEEREGWERGWWLLAEANNDYCNCPGRD